MKGVILILPMVCLLTKSVLANGNAKKFPAVDYVWPMTKTNKTYIIDRVQKVKADLHAIKFIRVRRLGYAASLEGNRQWIDVESGIASDCLAFQSSMCKIKKELAIIFWVRMRGGKRILATGSYTNSSSGPGVLFSYNAEDEMLTVEFANSERLWKVQAVLRRHRWTHIHAKWKFEKGLQVFFDGKNLVGKDAVGKEHQITAKTYNKMITIGRPESIYDIKGYGNFEISYLLIYFREPSVYEVTPIMKNTISTPTARELQCCSEKLVYENCLRDPCGSRRCIDVEEKFTNCICPTLRIEKCKSYPTEAPTTTSENCKQIDGSYTMNGCNNKKDRDGSTEDNNEDGTKDLEDRSKVSIGPKCNRKICYYGTCQKNMGIDVCTCPKCNHVSRDSRKPVCGTNYVTYENYCLLTRDACIKEKIINVLYNKSCSTSLDDAIHYWSLDNIRPGNVAKLEYTTDRNGNQDAGLSNNIRSVVHSQLGQVLQFDGENDFLDIARLNDECITNATCPNGISIGFWIKYEGGDTIMAAGSYYNSEHGPGFRMLRDKINKFFKLEVSDGGKVWLIYLPELPMEWFHITFTWQKDQGLFAYYNGEEKIRMNKPKTVKRRLSALERFRNRFPYIRQSNGRIRFANPKQTGTFGKFGFGHLAIWRRALTPKEVKNKYKATILVTKSHEDCCTKKRGTGCQYTRRDNEEDCLCPDDENYTERCPQHVVGPNKICRNEINHCSDFIKHQDGYCDNFKYNSTMSCRSTCELCNPSFLASMSPRKHFSQETLIFSLLGCVGGLVLLFGVMFYFWKIYRTQCYPSSSKNHQGLLLENV